MRASVSLQAPPQSIAEYIEEMLSELALLAESAGERKLATSMRLLAIEAARAVPED